MVRRGTRRTAQKETAVEQSENGAPLAPPKEVKITKKAAAAAKKNAPQTEPVEDANRRGSLINLFDKIQYGKLTDENALSILVHLYTQARESKQKDENVLDTSSGFNEQMFSNIMSGIMVQNFAIAVKSVPVERTIKIYAAFVCHCLHHELLYVDSFSWLVNEFHDDIRKSFRLRVCQAVLAVMSKCANEEIELTDQLWKVMRDALIVRSRDKMFEVRVVAVKALVYFQPRLGEEECEDDEEDSDNEGQPRKLENDPVVKQLAYLLEFEQSAEIRKVVLESLQINNTTMLKCIIRHCRDVDLPCRATAFNSVALSVSIKALSSQQRVDILTIAFRNSGSAPLMDKAVKNLVNGWLSQVGGQIPNLLILIDPVCYPDLCGKLLKTILASVSGQLQQAVDSIDVLDDRKLLGDEYCKPEYIFWWVSLLKFLKEMNQTDLFDSLSPNVTEFAQYIAHHFKRVKETTNDDEMIVRTFVNQQLLDIAAILDYSMDELGRKNMTRVLEAHLKDSSSNEYSRLVKQEMEVLLKLLGKQKFIHACLDAISELRFPIGGTSSDDFLINNTTNLTNVSRRAVETTAATHGENNEGENAGKEETMEEAIAQPAPPAVDEDALREMLFKAAKIRVEIHKLRDVLDECVAQQNFIKAQEEKEKLATLEEQLRHQQIEINNLKAGANAATASSSSEEATSNQSAETGDSHEGEAARVEEHRDGETNQERNVEGEENAGDGIEEHRVRATANAAAGIADSQESFDHVAVFHWLSIAHRIPQMLFFHTLPMSLMELRNCLVGRLATSVDAVRLKTVQCLGVYSMFDRDYATQMLPIIVQVLIMDRKESVQITAFRIIMDLFLRYGVTIAGDQLTQETFVESGLMDLTSLNDTFLNHMTIVNNSSAGSVPSTPQVPGSTSGADPWMDDESESSNSARLVKLVVKYLDNVIPEMRSVAAEGLAKLLLHDRITSPDIFARLCILWFSPTSKQDKYLRQCLGQFFPLFAVKSTQHQECVRRAFLPIIRTIFKAPLTSPLAMIDCKLLVQYLVTLTSPCNEKLMQHDVTALDVVKKAAVHEKLGKQLCEEILSHPDEMYVGTLVTALKYIHLEEDSAILPLSQFLDYLTQIHLNVDLGVNKKELSRIRTKISGQLNITSRSSQISDDDGRSSQNASCVLQSNSRILQASALLNQSSVENTPALPDSSNNRTMVLQTPRFNAGSLASKNLATVDEEVSAVVATSPLAEFNESSNMTAERVESPRKRKKRAPNARRGRQAAK